MAIYPRLFADFRHTSYQEQTTQAAGALRWHCPPGDLLPAQAPSTLVLNEDGLTVEMPDRLVRLDRNGKPAWQEPREPRLGIFEHSGVVYYRGNDRFLHGVDAGRKQILSEFHIPNCFDRGGVLLVYPAGDGKFLMQTFNRAHEVMEEKPPESDDYSFFLMGPRDWNDWDWLQEYDGRAMPGLVSGDGAGVTCVDEQNEVLTLDAATGQQKNRFAVQDGTVLRASLDHEDDLVAVVATAAGELVLRNYALDGSLQWEGRLAPQGATIGQPPAIDGDNRVLCLVGDDLLVLEQGKLQWRKPLPAGPVRYVTVLGDNSALVVGGPRVLHLDRDGRELLDYALEDGAVITAPAVVDQDGRIYLGTAAGVYCLE